MKKDDEAAVKPGGIGTNYSSFDHCRELDLTPQEEEYTHLFQSVQDLNEAWEILRELKECAARDSITIVEAAAFRYALIAYSRPYTASFGNVTKLHKLDDRYVPVAHRPLHKRLLDRRDRIHAHSDLTILDAVVRVREIQGQKYTTQVRNKVDHLEGFKDIDKLIQLVEETLEAMYIRSVQLEQSLPVNAAEYVRRAGTMNTKKTR